MGSDTKLHIQSTAKRLFALSGYDGLSMRTLAQHAGVASSVTYHHFHDKDVLLEQLFNDTRLQLGQKRNLLKEPKSASEQLRQRVEFQFDNAEDVVFVLKYFLHFRPGFNKLERGYIPVKAYLHIEEVLRHGIATGEFDPNINVAEQAKIITHAINGFVLEYFPDPPTGKERRQLVDGIVSFITRAIERRVPAL